MKSGYSGLFVYRFLESGKSTCFQEILEEGNFEDGLRTLYLMTEEGEKKSMKCYFVIIKWTRF